MTPTCTEAPVLHRHGRAHARLRRVTLALALATLVPLSALADAPASDAAAVRAGMSAELMYRLMVADIALQRGQPALAARAYYEAAREAREPAFARRATEIALTSRQRSVAQQAAKLWSELDPASERARQVLASLASGTAGAAESDGDLKAHLARLLAEAATKGPALGDAFLQINRVLEQTHDPAQALKLVQTLAEPYQNVPEAEFAVALAALRAGLGDVGTLALARKSIDRALALKPGWDRAALLKSEILGKQSRPEAIAFLQSFVDAHPASRPAAGALGQMYVDDKRYGDARAVFRRLAEADSNNRDVRLALASIAMQAKDWDAAEAELRSIAGEDEDGTVAYYLAQVAEESNRLPLAIERYRAVPEGERGWQARLRIGALLAKSATVAEAQRYLADLPAVTIEQRVQVRQAEAQVLRDAGDLNGAHAVLTRALKEHPDDPDLLYDVAMVAEKLGKVDETESRLKRVIELRPDNAHALNALGYTLVDRTDRHAEGLELIERAHKLMPDDGFILDSMGWALYRLNRLEEAEAYLRRAIQARPDAEIAAHLGEVLWARGERDRAREIWQSQLKSSPDNPVLLETVRRLAQ
jgi:tetratricopeptide (TPR) repeat protein